MDDNETSETGSDHENNHKSVKHETIKPLDGGWGWIILFGSFFINFICELNTMNLNKFPQMITRTDILDDSNVDHRDIPIGFCTEMMI